MKNYIHRNKQIVGLCLIFAVLVLEIIFVMYMVNLHNKYY